MMTTIPIIVQILAAGVALAPVAGAALLGIGYTKARDEPMLQEWAKRDGVQLLHSEPRAVRMYGSPWTFEDFHSSGMSCLTLFHDSIRASDEKVLL